MSPLSRRVVRIVNGAAVAVYRLSKGRIGGQVKGIPILLLTIPGRKSGTPHTVAVTYVDVDGGYLVVGSGGGMPEEPQWFRNLRATGTARVEFGDRAVDVGVSHPSTEERDRLWRDVVLPTAPFFAGYEAKAPGRVIPVALLTPVG